MHVEWMMDGITSEGSRTVAATEQQYDGEA